MKQSQSGGIRDIYLSITFMLLLVLMAGGMAVYLLADPALKQAGMLATTAMRLDQIYGDELDHDAVIANAREAMLARLDRFSGYVDNNQFDRMHEELSGAYGGIGVTVVGNHNGLEIISVREGGPADKAGVLNGDIILRADSLWLRSVSHDEASEALRGPEDTQVWVMLFRPLMADTIETEVTRARIDLLHIPFAGFTPDSLIYVRLLDFQAGASHDMKQALDSLLAILPHPPGIILDLKGNPGGLFSEAYQTANLFLAPGQFIVGTDARSRWEEEAHYSSGNDITDNTPLAILVDAGTASSAEIVSGSLRQLNRATLFGDTTFGKGLVQGFSRFDDGSGLRLTISRYYLSGPVFLNEFDSLLHDTGHGLVPDYYIPFEERREFSIRLEQSQLLQQFARQYAEEIAAIPVGFSLDDSWVERFATFAADSGFVFVSRRTEYADLIADLARLDLSSPAVKRATEKLVRVSQGIDGDQFEAFAPYIKRRLRQIAYEHTYGQYRTYRDIVVRERQDIRFVSEFLQGRISE